MASERGVLDALKENKEIELTVKGRVTGKAVPRPVWFTLSKDEKTIFLIPMSGRKTQWYLNVKKEPAVTIRVGGRAFNGRLTEADPRRFKEAVDTFTSKFGEQAMEEYYELEVAFELPLSSLS
jgi:hypothetical protein